MSATDIQVRPAAMPDLDAMATMASELVRLHHAWDAERFFLAKGVERGYREWFGRELANEDATLLVAARGSEIVGYAYGRLEPRDWNLLLDRHAALHDVWVQPDSRGQRIAEALVRAFCSHAEARGAPRVVLHTASTNASGQALFARLGFRPTMIEMTRESAPRNQRTVE